MHDCPACGVPLHGHEQVCPSCDTRQYVRKSSYTLSPLPKEPGINLLPVVILAVIAGIGLFAAAQTTWIGELLRQDQHQQDPLDKMTPQDARNLIESKITQGLAAAGAKGRLAWKQGQKTVDKSSPEPVELSIETSLSNPDLHHSIIDPVKDYMDKAKIPTLTITDNKSHATWTYTVTPATPSTTPDAQDQEAAPTQ